MSINIFDIAKPQGGTFFSFKNVGDQVQGTYIDTRAGIDGYGNHQIIYVIQDAEKNIWNVGFRDAANVIHDRMKNIRFGQIIGFRFDGLKDSKKFPGKQIKLIRVYDDPKSIDHEWLARQAEIKAEIEKNGVGSAPTTPQTPSTPSSGFGVFDNQSTSFKAPENAVAASGGLPTNNNVAEVKPQNEAINAIRNLAKTKNLTTGFETEAEADAAIEKYTGLKLVDENFTKIIISLTGYSGK